MSHVVEHLLLLLLPFSACEPFIDVDSKDMSRAQPRFFGCLCQTFSLIFRQPNRSTCHFQPPINVCFVPLPMEQKVLF